MVIFLILPLLLDKKSKRMVGCGFFQYSKRAAIYAVGAYDRTMFSKPLGHVVQWNAIKYMKKLALHDYYIGRYFTKADEPEPTKKELDISLFKKGFTKDICMSLLITV